MNTQKILNLVTAASITASGNGSAVAVPANNNGWVIYTSLGTVSGTSPTLDITVQHSIDGTNWATLSAVTQRVAASASTVLYTFASTSTDYLKPIMPYVRASYTIGGSATPTFNTVQIDLLVK